MSSNRNYSRNQRETKTEELPEDRADWSELDTYIEEANSRRAEERAHGAARLLELFSATAQEAPSVSEEQIDAILDACRGALDARREPTEREQLVRVACNALAWDMTPLGFAAEFGEALGVSALQAARGGEEMADLAVAMFHAVAFAQAVEGNGIKAGPDTRLAHVIAKDAAGKAIPVAVADLALLRCAVLTATEEEDKELVRTAIRTRLAKYADNLIALCEVVKCFALAVEAHGTGDVLTPASIEEFEEASAKLEGGKDKKKELAQLVRTVTGYIRSGDGPWTTMTLQSSRRADNIEVKLESFSELAVVESLRAVTGDRSSLALRQSPLMHALFGIEAPDSELESYHAKATRVAAEDREARYNRLVANKARDRGIARARDRKLAQDEA